METFIIFPEDRKSHYVYTYNLLSSATLFGGKEMRKRSGSIREIEFPVFALDGDIPEIIL